MEDEGALRRLVDEHMEQSREEQIAGLIAALPPAPAAWVRAAQELPEARAEIADPSSRDFGLAAGELEAALTALCAGEAEVESHMVTDARAVHEIEDALCCLGQRGDRGQAIEKLESALLQLAADDVRGRQAVERIDRALALLRR